MNNLDEQWREQAAKLAKAMTLPDSRWHQPIATTPRHMFFPRWFERAGEGRWELKYGSARPSAWMRIAYESTASVITKVGPYYADSTRETDVVTGRPTSSATNAWRLVEMYRAARIYPGCGEILDIGTGSGYGAALLSTLMGDEHVTAIDVDPYLTQTATARLKDAGHTPTVLIGDATGPLDWEGDRIVATVAVPAIPASWLAALHTGGRLAVNITGTLITITARKMADGSAWGRVEFDYRGGFMHTRSASDYAPSTADALLKQPDNTFENTATSTSLFPVIDLDQAAELSSVLSLTIPGIRWSYSPSGNSAGWPTARLAHPDGSWAKAEGPRGASTSIRQAGPRRLWDELDRIRSDWLTDGSLHLYGAEVRIMPDGTAHFTGGPWSAILPAAEQPQPTG